MILAGFRSYAAVDLAVEARILALVGENGAGKTNILEALSLFSPGRGLRRADLADMAKSGGAGVFSASIRLADGRRLGTGTEHADGGSLVRKCRMDGVALGSPAAFGEVLRLVWLTPASDGLFVG
ncbi:MAG: AAA family ATPase, partial [Alsobacter sp.]